MNFEMTQKSYTPIYTAAPNAHIVIVGQAPGRSAQASMQPWFEERVVPELSRRVHEIISG